MDLFDFSQKDEVEIPTIIIIHHQEEKKIIEKSKDIIIDNNIISKVDYRKGLFTSHQYYSQYVTQSIIDLVISRLGIENIMKSTKNNFSDIRLDIFDSLDGPIYKIINKQQIKDTGEDIPFLCFHVCIVKAAATKIKESYGI